MKISRILFASDLHGSDLVFNNLINTAITNKVDALIIGGDISGKTLTPIIKRIGGKYEAKFLGKIISVNQGKELDDLQRDIANSGSYSYITDDDGHKKIEHDKIFQYEIILRLTQVRAKQWIAIAEQKLKPQNIRFIIICGNDDDLSLDNILANSTFAENPEKKVLTICDNHEVIGESYANKTPFPDLPRDVDDSILEQHLRDKIKNLKDVGRSILIIHTPPFDSGLDKAHDLDKNLKQIVVGGAPVMKAVGSKSVRKIIEEFQPMLTLHGHIHESHGFARIGKTYCFNAGSEYSNAYLRAYLITMNSDSILGHFLIRK